jgi:hypothetical protein
MWHVWVRGEVHTGLWWGNLREGDRLKDPSVDGRILECISDRLDGETDWIELAQGRDKWRAVVNAVMNLRGFLKIRGIS